jgi:general secretion pathway protein D
VIQGTSSFWLCGRRSDQGKIEPMRLPVVTLALCLLAAFPAFAGDNAAPDGIPMISCGNGIPGGINCLTSSRDLKLAHATYARGRKLQEHQQLEEAFSSFDEASRLAPQETSYFEAREIVKAQLVYQHTARGDSLLADGRAEQAAAEFRAALKLDPDNDYTQQRLAESLRTPVAAKLAGLPALLAESTEIHLQPKPELATFHYEGDSRGLLTQLGLAYGITVEFDDSLKQRNVRFYVDNVDFFTALNLACKVSKAMWTALDAHQILLAEDSAENHKQFDRMSLATFSVPNASTPQQVTEMVNSLRNICEFQKITSSQNGVVEVRAPQATLAACTKLVGQLGSGTPQVAIDLEIYQISHLFTREIGMHIPDTFNMYNIPAAALLALGGQSISSLVNQLVSSGGINQAGSSALSGLLAQLQNQQSGIFSQPLATFGNGLSFSGVSLDHLTTALSLNESWAQSISHVTLRAEQGNEATLHIGERYPILNASYSPIYNSPAISAVLGNQSYVPPVPSVSYEDLGLSMKAKPVIHADGQVSLTFQMQVRSLTGQSANGVPVISNQEYDGGIRLNDGEGAVIAGEVSTNDERSMAGIPIVSEIPGLNWALGDNNQTKEYDELLIVLTPHILSNRQVSTPEIWVTQQ